MRLSDLSLLAIRLLAVYLFCTNIVAFATQPFYMLLNWMSDSRISHLDVIDSAIFVTISVRFGLIVLSAILFLKSEKLNMEVNRNIDESVIDMMTSAVITKLAIIIIGIYNVIVAISNLVGGVLRKIYGYYVESQYPMIFESKFQSDMFYWLIQLILMIVLIINAERISNKLSELSSKKISEK
jgi:hypothetical protein